MEKLRGELAALNVQIATAGGEVSRLAIARETQAALGVECIPPVLQFESPRAGSRIRTICPHRSGRRDRQGVSGG